jgi:hypothetical protein
VPDAGGDMILDNEPAEVGKSVGVVRSSQHDRDLARGKDQGDMAPVVNPHMDQIRGAGCWHLRNQQRESGGVLSPGDRCRPAETERAAVPRSAEPAALPRTAGTHDSADEHNRRDQTETVLYQS